MIKLITIQDIIEFKPMSLNTNTAKALDPYIVEAQEFDLKPFLGDPFYLAILNDAPDFNNYFDLWNGQQYTWSSYDYAHNGLKAVLIYQAYARYLVNANSTETPFGVVAKRNDFSDQIDTKALSMKIQQARAGAKSYQQQVEDYLNRNLSDFPLWRIGCNTPNNNSSVRISRIKRY